MHARNAVPSCAEYETGQVFAAVASAIKLVAPRAFISNETEHKAINLHLLKRSFADAGIEVTGSFLLGGSHSGLVWSPFRADSFTVRQATYTLVCMKQRTGAQRSGFVSRARYNLFACAEFMCVVVLGSSRNAAKRGLHSPVLLFLERATMGSMHCFPGIGDLMSARCDLQHRVSLGDAQGFVAHARSVYLSISLPTYHVAYVMSVKLQPPIYRTPCHRFGSQVSHLQPRPMQAWNGTSLCLLLAQAHHIAGMASFS